MKTQSPLLDFNGTGKMKRVSASEWLVTNKQVMEVKRFEKKCYERDADFLSTTKAINKFNENLKDLND